MDPESCSAADQLLAALRASPSPLDLDQLVLAAPCRVELYPGCEPRWHSRARSARTRIELCAGTHHLHVRTRYAREVYRLLRILVAAGEVQQVVDGDDRDLRWRATTPDRFLTGLEACWHLDPLARDR